MPYGLAGASGTAAFRYYPHVSIFSGRFADEVAERETVRTFLKTRADSGRDLTPGQVDELLDERLSSRPFNCPLKTISQVIRER